MNKKPKILIYDIETSPNLAYVWEKYEQDVLEYEQEWQLLSFAYKWYGEDKVTCHTSEGYKTDKQLTKKLWKLFDEADILVAHNGDEFDQKKARARFIYHGLPATKPTVSIDTLKIARKYFKFNSNKLDDIGRFLKLGRKVQTGGFSTWLGCLKGNKKSWQKMMEYNKQDVKLLEKIYDKLKPYHEKHPYLTDYSCNKCGSKKIQKGGILVTATKPKQRWKCLDCGGWFSTAYKKS